MTQHLIAQSTIAELAAEYNLQADYLCTLGDWHKAQHLDRATLQGIMIGLQRAMTITAKHANIRLTFERSKT